MLVYCAPRLLPPAHVFGVRPALLLPACCGALPLAAAGWLRHAIYVSIEPEVYKDVLLLVQQQGQGCPTLPLPPGCCSPLLLLSLPCCCCCLTLVVCLSGWMQARASLDGAVLPCGQAPVVTLEVLAEIAVRKPACQDSLLMASSSSQLQSGARTHPPSRGGY